MTGARTTGSGPRTATSTRGWSRSRASTTRTTRSTGIRTSDPLL